MDFCIEDFGTSFRVPDSRFATKLLAPLHRGPVLEFARDTGLALFSQWPSRFREIAHANEIFADVILNTVI